jgi:hypothetical protein
VPAAQLDERFRLDGALKVEMKLGLGQRTD